MPVTHNDLMKRMEYNPMLRDLLFHTCASSFIAHLGKRRDLVTLSAFKDIDSVAPALSISEREKLYEYMLQSSSLPFIPAFNVRGIEVPLPENIYEMLDEIEVDELNLTRMLVMIKHKAFPNLQSLIIYTEGDIIFPLEELRGLRSLTLHNLTSEIRLLPNLDGLSLEALTLSGYILEFQGSLPQNLRLEQCFVRNSGGLQGCESMILFHTKWVTPSFPSKYLMIEGGQLSAQPPSSIESLTLINCKLASRESAPRGFSLTAIRSLRELRIDRCVGVIKIEPQLPIVSLIVNFDYLIVSGSIQLPETLTTLRLNSRSHSHELTQRILRFPPRLLILELYECIVDLYNLLGDLPSTVQELGFIRCTIHSQRLIESGRFPRNLRTLSFIRCEAEDILSYPVIPETLEQLTVIGGKPGVHGEARRQMLSMTSVFMMDTMEFRLFCLDRLHKGMFKEFEDYYSDIVQAPSWITDEKKYEYLGILMMYAFQIPLPSDVIIIKGILKHANEDMIIKLGRHNHTVKYLRELVRQAREEDLEMGRLDKELQAIVEKVLQ